MAARTLYAVVAYEDQYVQPLLVEALKKQLPDDLLVLIDDISQRPSDSDLLLQWRQYESIVFDDLLQQPKSSLANSYVIRKALIRKHFLATTVSHWSTKHPETILKNHVKASVEFEVDFAEFLDDALIEAYELKDSWARNDEAKEGSEKEWWILKPGMSDRGQGIRLFSSESELQDIFDKWDPPSDDEDEATFSRDSPTHSHSGDEDDEHGIQNGVVTSHLRHFIAQPYVHPPLLLPEPHPSSRRKFHIRTYVVAVGALKVYVYKPMLALFAGAAYTAPHASPDPNENLSSHLTNTCLQSGEREGSVEAFWSLPSQMASLSAADWRHDVFRQICSVTGEIFEAAARSMSVYFQPLPNAFEIFGLDFMVDARGTAWLLEVNAFPDFAQTGSELQGVIRDLFEDVVSLAVKPFFGLAKSPISVEDRMQEVLDLDLGRR